MRIEFEGEPTKPLSTDKQDPVTGLWYDVEEDVCFSTGAHKDDVTWVPLSALRSLDGRAVDR